MRYIFVEWIHDVAEDPFLFYSELDEDRWEVRKVEIYRDGKVGFADAERSVEGADLGLVPLPPLEEINADPELVGREIDGAEFERVWKRATERGG